MTIVELPFVWIAGVLFSEFIKLLVDRDNAPSSLYDRSRCENCKKEVPWFALIPVLGFVIVKGKCFYCKAEISPTHPIFELVFSIFWGIILAFPLTSLQLVSFYFFLCMVFYLAYYDYKHFEVPIIALAVGVISQFALGQALALPLMFTDAIIIFSIIGLSVLAVKLLKKNIPLSEMFGAADWILLLSSAVVFGYANTVYAIVASIFFLVLYLIANNKRKVSELHVPYLFCFLPALLVVAIYLTSTVIYR